MGRGEAKDSALLSSRDAGLLEPPERPQGSPASSSVWRYKEQQLGNLADVGRSREKEGKIQRGRELLRRAPALMITDPEKQVFTVCSTLHCLQDVGASS